MVQRCPLVPAIGDTLAGAATSFEVWIWGVSSSKIPKLCPSVATSDQVRSPDFGAGIFGSYAGASAGAPDAFGVCSIAVDGPAMNNEASNRADMASADIFFITSLCYLLCEKWSRKTVWVIKRQAAHVFRYSVIMAEVWIVQHDEEELFNAVLGVFASEDEAEEFAEEIKNEYARGAIYSRYEIGYRYNRGPGHVSFGSGDR
jgi:hypothetical protein